MYHKALLLTGVLVVGLAVAAGANTTLKSKFACSGFPDSQISVSVRIDGTPTTIKWKAKNLPPGAAVACGYSCIYGGTGVFGSCPDVLDSGKWKHAQEDLFPPECFGLVPRIEVDGNTQCYPRIE